MSIDIKKLTSDDIGRLVVYENHYANKLEEGVITSWNDEYIFVRYGADKHSKATYPQDLRYAIK